MILHSLRVLICSCVLVAPAGVLACGNHFYLNPEDMGFLAGTVARAAGLIPPEPVFNLENPAMARATIGERNEIRVNYSRPFFSNDVRLEVSGTENVRVLNSMIPLEERKGTIAVPYELLGSGFDTITLTVIGQHKGETVRESARVFVRASGKSTQEAVQISER